jgi:hypothetical protein
MGLPKDTEDQAHERAEQREEDYWDPENDDDGKW